LLQKVRGSRLSRLFFVAKLVYKENPLPRLNGERVKRGDTNGDLKAGQDWVPALLGLRPAKTTRELPSQQLHSDLLRVHEWLLISYMLPALSAKCPLTGELVVPFWFIVANYDCEIRQFPCHLSHLVSEFVYLIQGLLVAWMKIVYATFCTIPLV